MAEQWQKKTTVLLAFENLIVVRGNSSIFTQETTSRDEAISGPQAEESLLVDGVYVLAKHRSVPAYFY